MVPADRRFLESHEWCKLDGDVATVGISAFAVEHLSDLTYLDLPETGTRLEKGERFGEIESVKAVSELFSPISGEVIDVNRALADSLETLGQDPYGKGWMLRVRVSSPAEFQTLMDSAAYEKVIAQESE